MLLSQQGNKVKIWIADLKKNPRACNDIMLRDNLIQS